MACFYNIFCFFHILITFFCYIFVLLGLFFCFNLIITALFDSVVIVQNYIVFKYENMAFDGRVSGCSASKKSTNYLQLFFNLIIIFVNFLSQALINLRQSYLAYIILGLVCKIEIVK